VYWPTPAHLATRIGSSWCKSPRPLLILHRFSGRYSPIFPFETTSLVLVDPCPGGSEFRRTGLWERKISDWAGKLRSRTRTVSGWDAKDTEGDAGCVKGIGRTCTLPPLLVHHRFHRRSLLSSTAFDVSISPTTSITYSSTIPDLSTSAPGRAPHSPKTSSTSRYTPQTPQQSCMPCTMSEVPIKNQTYRTQIQRPRSTPLPASLDVFTQMISSQRHPLHVDLVQRVWRIGNRLGWREIGYGCDQL